jgi:hypothetical protein
MAPRISDAVTEELHGKSILWRRTCKQLRGTGVATRKTGETRTLLEQFHDGVTAQ